MVVEPREVGGLPEKVVESKTEKNGSNVVEKACGSRCKACSAPRSIEEG